MNKKTKLVVLGSIVGVLAIVVIYVNFFAGSGNEVPQAVLQEASKAADEASKTETPPPAPPQDRRGTSQRKN